MNENQRAAIRKRQLARVEVEPTMPPAALTPAPEIDRRSMDDIAADLRPEVGPGVPVAFLRFLDKAFQLRGMSSGETYTARVEPNQRVHRIEMVMVGGVSTFMTTFIDPARREVVFEFIERSAVKTWKMA